MTTLMRAQMGEPEHVCCTLLLLSLPYLTPRVSGAGCGRNCVLGLRRLAAQLPPRLADNMIGKSCRGGCTAPGDQRPCFVAASHAVILLHVQGTGRSRLHIRQEQLHWSKASCTVQIVALTSCCHQGTLQLIMVVCRTSPISKGDCHHVSMT